MKQKFTSLLIAISCIVRAQIVVDFENLAFASSDFYKDTTSKPFQVKTAVFPYSWDTSYDFWAGGFSYSNHRDSTTGTASNLYGVKPYTGFNLSDKWVVAQQNAVMHFSTPQRTLNSMYVTNTAYAFKVMRNGNQFSRKFGDTTHAGTGTTVAQGTYPDYFKLVIRAYSQGQLKPDSVEFFLADYRYQNSALDYIVDTWEFVNLSFLGVADSVLFQLRSTDNSSFGMNTPGFFAIDNFMYTDPTAGISETMLREGFSLFPNPAQDLISWKFEQTSGAVQTRVINASGQTVIDQEVHSGDSMNISMLAAGVYGIQWRLDGQWYASKFIKN